MTKLEKLCQSFLENPNSLSYSEIEKLLLWIGFEKVKGKGCHVKFNHGKDSLVFSIHNRDVKPYQKDKALKLVLKINYLDPRVRGIWRPIRRELTALDTVTHRSFPDFLHNCL